MIPTRLSKHPLRYSVIFQVAKYALLGSLINFISLENSTAQNRESFTKSFALDIFTSTQWFYQQTYTNRMNWGGGFAVHRVYKPFTFYFEGSFVTNRFVDESPNWMSLKWPRPIKEIEYEFKEGKGVFGLNIKLNSQDSQHRRRTFYFLGIGNIFQSGMKSTAQIHYADNSVENHTVRSYTLIALRLSGTCLREIGKCQFFLTIYTDYIYKESDFGGSAYFIERDISPLLWNYGTGKWSAGLNLGMRFGGR